MQLTAQQTRLAVIVVALVIALTVVPNITSGQNKNISQLSAKILSAKTAYFENQTGNSAVGNKAVAELQKWGRFKLTIDPKSADVIILLSAVRYSSGMIFLGKQLGTGANATPPEFAYLTVADPATEQSLYTDSCHWGGVLTGVNSAGVRLIKKLKKQVSK